MAPVASAVFVRMEHLVDFVLDPSSSESQDGIDGIRSWDISTPPGCLLLSHKALACHIEQQCIALERGDVRDAYFSSCSVLISPVFHCATCVGQS